MAAIGDSMIDTSDSDGRYSFRNVAPGIYNVQALQLKQRTRMLVTGLEVDSGTTTVPPETLREPGVIRFLLLGSTEHNGYAIIPGTDIATFVAMGSMDILLDSVPAGRIPEVRYTVLGDTVSISRQGVDVVAADTTILADPSWHYSRRIVLNTSAAGAGISGDLYGFPVLIRLTPDDFDFTQAKTGGADLRFSSSYGSPLHHEIEQWDSAAQSAAIWVGVDTVRGNDSTQSIMMYWGASTPSTGSGTSGTSGTSATSQSNGAAVFDTAGGFQGVWHLGEGGNTVALDATANRFDGTSYNMAATAPASGAIGEARTFDGDSSYITMPNTANGKLNFAEDGHYTLSAWVRADALDNKYRTIAAKGFRQYFLQVSQIPNPNLWQFSTFKDTSEWNMSHTPAAENQWVLVTGVKYGDQQDLYVNGELIVKSDATGRTYDQKPMIILRDTSENFTIGRFFNEATYPLSGAGYCYFEGAIDEVRICSTARSAHWIKLCYMNQRSDDRLVQFER